MPRKRGIARLQESKGVDLKGIMLGIKPRIRLSDHPEVLADIVEAQRDLRYANTAKEAGRAAVQVLEILVRAGLAKYGVG